jgi:copper chaperone CopZ
MPTLTLAIDGMSCQHCVRAVRLALEPLDGITIHEVGLGTARIETDDAGAHAGPITAAIENAGYHVTSVTS